MTEIVPATAELMAQLMPEITYTCRALAVVDGDKVLGVGGYYLQGGRQIVFCKISDEARAELPRRARLLLKVTRMVLAMTSPAMPVNAIPDPSIEAAPRFLEHFGFRKFHGEAFQWKWGL